MPRRSERANLIENFENTLAACIMSKSMEMIASCINSSSSVNNSSSFESGDESFDNLSTLYSCILSQRYFAKRHHERVDSSRMASDILRMNLNRFKEKFRMSPYAFERIWNMMKDHKIFTNNSTSVQFDPRMQFLIVLDLFIEVHKVRYGRSFIT